MEAHSSLADLGGVGIYVPFVTDEQDLLRLGLEKKPFGSRRGAQDPKSETSQTTYENLALFSAEHEHDRRGTWPALVYDELSEPIPEELVNLIADIGVTSSSDRAEIAQIVLSIESTFNKLDRVLGIAQMVMTARMQQTPPVAIALNPNAKQPPLWLMPMRTPTRGSENAAPPVQVSEPLLLEWFRKLEAVLEEVEQATKKGLTQARFGLGPVLSPRAFDEPVKTDEGAPPLSPVLSPRGFDEPVKTDEGAPPRDDGSRFSGGPARTYQGFLAQSTAADPDVGPAFLLFRRAAGALQQLEQAVSDLEGQAGPSLGADIFERRDLGLRRALAVLCETATSARLTIRNVIANPSYGLGPSSAAFDLDDREELANRAGLSARNLVLLSVNSLVPEPDAGELIGYGKV
jgi:hypothetical protein